jgi:hypothetical protein
MAYSSIILEVEAFTINLVADESSHFGLVGVEGVKSLLITFSIFGVFELDWKCCYRLIYRVFYREDCEVSLNLMY